MNEVNASRDFKGHKGNVLRKGIFWQGHIHITRALILEMESAYLSGSAFRKTIGNNYRAMTDEMRHGYTTKAIYWSKRISEKKASQGI